MNSRSRIVICLVPEHEHDGSCPKSTVNTILILKSPNASSAFLISRSCESIQIKDDNDSTLNSLIMRIYTFSIFPWCRDKTDFDNFVHNLLVYIRTKTVSVSQGVNRNLHPVDLGYYLKHCRYNENTYQNQS